MPLVAVDCQALARLGEERLPAAVRQARLFAVLHGALVALCKFPRGKEGRSLFRAFFRRSKLIALLSDELPDALKTQAEEVLRIRFSPHTLAQRRSLWEHFLAPYPLNGGVDVQSYANKYAFTAGKVGQIARTARLESMAAGRDGIDSGDIEAAVRACSLSDIGGRATRVPCVWGWEDITLHEEEKRVLHAACDQLKFRHIVNEQWGFGKKLPYGAGLSILLYGPPGTGKSMSAQVIAGELGLDLYRVDLSQMVSKYIGETEKNLGEVFRFARETNCVLFFDEGDSLFSKRTEVGDAKDRYANVETAYLLQKIEEHDGVTILATNNMSNIDKAFKRRFRYILGLNPPDEGMRLQIWQRVFPSETPLGPTVDLPRLARRYELTGASIKSAALSACYLAAARGSAVEMEHLLAAVREELLKNGHTLSAADQLG